MPYSYPDNLPKPALNWSAEEQQKCVEAANAVLNDNGSEQDAIFACIHAAGRTENPGGEGKALTIKAETDKHVEIDGLAIPYIGPFEGNKDFDGEKFTPQTDLCLDWFPHGRPVLFNHGFDEDVGLRVIGRQVKTWEDESGRWAKVQIEKSNQYWQEIQRLVSEGKLFFSSGALSRFVEKDTSGNIVRWPWVELTLTPTPANPYAVTMPTAQKSYKAAGLDFTIPDEGEAQDPQKSEDAEPEPGGGKHKSTEVLKMEDEKLQATVAEAVASAFKAKEDAEAAEKAKVAAEAEAEKTRQAEIDAAVDKALKGALANSKMVHPTGEKKSRILVGSKYDALDDVELDILGVMCGKSSYGWSEKLRNAIGDRYDGRVLVDTKARSDSDFDSIKAVTAMDLTDTANWVPTAWSGELWRKLRLENKVSGLFKHIDLPANTYEMPTESTDPTVYKVAEFTGASDPALTTGPTASAPADTKVSFSTSKLGALVWVSGELDEDNAFPLIPLVRDQMGRKTEDAIEYVILSGDTETGTSNVSVTSPGATDKTVLDDGLRKYCLVTATGQGVSVGELTYDDLINIRYLLGKQGVDPTNLAWICDYGTYLKRLLAIDEFMTMDKYGAAATILKGELGKISSIPVIVSENLDKTGTNGKTISGGTVGSILLVARDRWMCGWRRHLKFWQQYYGNVDATQLVVMCRFCFVGFNETDGTDVALGYNVTL